MGLFIKIMLHITSGTEQVANHLKKGLMEGRWTGTMPGRDKLSREIGVNRKTVDAALQQLENTGFLLSQGPRRRRKIAPLDTLKKQRALRIAILFCYPEDAMVSYITDLHHRLEKAGHTTITPSHSINPANMDTQRLAKLVNTTNADAWLVVAGSRDILEWFANHPSPAFALFGRRRNLPIAGIGPNKADFISAVTQRLIELGHKRIVSIVREGQRLPKPSLAVRAFVSEMENAGIPTSSYNLPHWEETRDGIEKCIDNTFKITPPTALIIDEPQIFASIQMHLARRGILSPEQVSMICCESDPSFGWHKPPIAHMQSDSAPWIRRIITWANNISRGREDLGQSQTQVKFIEGGTVGPA